MKSTRWMLSLGLVCASAYADTVVTRGPWELFVDNTLLQGGFSSEAACINDATERNVTRTYNCRTRTTVAVTQTSTPPPTGGSGSYSTTFNLTEFPISEGGKWRKANNPWTNVRTANGTAFGSNGVTNSYDDSYALLSGFGPDQTVEATVQVNSGAEGATHEVELLLRASDDSNNARGYEVLFNKSGGYQIVRWNGPFGSFTPLNNNCPVTWTPASALRTGDVIKAEMIGNTLKAWQNGVLKACVQDSTFPTGNPGISFFIRPGGANNLLTFTQFTATSR
jgi:hypothetical protein